MSEYSEVEIVHSMQSEMDAITEWRRFCTNTSESKLQKGLIPVWLDFAWNIPKDHTYFKNEEYVVSRNPYETIIKFQKEGFASKLFINEQNHRFINGTMEELYNEGKTFPFLLFINNVFVTWDKLTLIKSDTFITFLIDRDRDIPINSVKILSIPFKINYNTINRDPAYGMKLFSFNKDGLYDENGDILFYSADENIKGIAFHDVNSFNKYDIGIDLEVYLNSDNVFVFNQDGTLYDYINSNNTKFNNGNLLTNGNIVTIKHIIILYNTKTPKRESISTILPNKAFTKRLLAGKENVENSIDLTILDRNFDFSYSIDSDYNTNKNASEYYIWDTFHRKYYGIVHHSKNMSSHEFTKDELIQDEDGYVYIRRDMYFDYPHRSFPLVFLDGIADSETNNSIIYDKDGHCFKFYTGNKVYEKCTILFFKNVINGKYDVHANSRGIIDITNTWIPPEEITILTDNKTNKFLYPINHTLVNNKTIKLEEPEFYKSKLYMCSKYQFIHERYVINNNVIFLSNKFETAYNKKNFMCFYKGRYINQTDFDVLLPDIRIVDKHTGRVSGGRVKRASIYFNFKVLEDTSIINDSYNRIIDVYYISSIPGNRIEPLDLIVDCAKVYATSDNQSTFTVPKPYKTFPIAYDTFFVIKNSQYVKNEKYTINSTNGTITFTNSSDFLNRGESLVFVLPNFKIDGELDGILPRDNVIYFDYFTKISPNSTTNKITINDYTPSTSTEGILVFKNLTFIDPSRYSISGNTITFTESILPNTKIMIAVPKDLTQNGNVFTNNITIETGMISITSANQYEYNIPSNISYDNLFIFMGSVLLSDSRYVVSSGDRKHILNTLDSFVPGQKLLFVNIKNKNDSNIITKDLNKMHVKSMHYGNRITANSTSYKIPVEEFMHAKFFEYNFLLFINTTFIDFDMYTVKNNEIIFNKNSLFKFNKGDWVEIVLFYKDNDYFNNFNGADSNNIGEQIYFEEISTPIVSNQTKYKIPYPNAPFTDIPFLVMVDSTFIPSYQYTLSSDNKYITINSSILSSGSKIVFRFVHNKKFGSVSKFETHYKLKNNQRQIQIQSPFNKSLNLNRRALVFLGNTYIDKDKYIVDNVNNIIKFRDTTTINSTDLTIVIFYIGTVDNKAPAWLSESGYISIQSRYMDRMYSNETLIIFVNGKLIPQSWVMNITDSLFKITKPLTSRYDLCILNGAPKIKELAEKYKNYTNDKDYISTMISTIKVGSELYH